MHHTGASQYTLDMVVSDQSNRAVQQQSTKPITPEEVDGYFDAHGNLKQLENSKDLLWGRHDQLKQVTLTANQQESYQYTVQGNRIRKTFSDTGTNTEREVVYLPGLELRLTRQQGKVSEEQHVVTIGNAGRAQVRLLHWVSGQPDDIPNNQLRYQLDNHLGSSHLELDQNADILTREEYYPFGGTAVWSAKSRTEAKYKTIRYSGKERDVTGLYYYGYRYYVAWMGRWLNPDPAWTVDELNLYRMVRNNPINRQDPNGALSIPGPLTPISKGVKKLDKYLTRKTTNFLMDRGASVPTINKWNRIRRGAMLGVGLGASLATIASGAGAAVGIAMGIGAVGFLAGAAIGWFANKISDKFAGAMARRMQGQTVATQMAGGAAVATTSAVLHNASNSGTAVAAGAGALSGGLGALLDNSEAGMAGANAAGSAVGTADTLSGGTASLPVQVGASAGGAVGGWILGTTEGSTDVGEWAGIGAYSGGRLGRYVDRQLSSYNILSFISNYSQKWKAISWALKKVTPKSSGSGEWALAAIGGIGAGAYRATDIRTDGEMTRINQAASTAWYTVSWNKFSRAFDNYFMGGANESLA